MACNEYICEGYSLGLNRCSTGFVVYVSQSIGTNIRADIKIGDRTFCVNSVVGCFGKVVFDWKPAEYLPRGNYEVSLSLFKGRDLITFPFEDTCIDVCGIEMIIRDDCYEGYVYINQECSLEGSYNWSIPYYNCNWSTNIQNCEWTINSNNARMINSIRYGNSKINLNNNPIVRNGSLAEINPLFEDELEAIEAGAFLVTLIDDQITWSYIGTENVEFYDNCELITKTCI